VQTDISSKEGTENYRALPLLGQVRCSNLPLNFHSAAIKGFVNFTSCGAGEKREIGGIGRLCSRPARIGEMLSTNATRHQRSHFFWNALRLSAEVLTAWVSKNRSPNSVN
jgi:hypothetical protein